MTGTVNPIAPAPAEPPEDEFALLGATVRIGEPHPLSLGPRLPPWAETLGPYRLRRQLGCGGMGIVYEAEDQGTRERFAIKVLRPTLAAEPQAKLRFFQEARAMASIGHQRI